MMKRLAEAGLAWLHSNQEKVNQLNVFPVPDGDTGTNMGLTMQSAWNNIASLDEPHVGKLTQALARGALMGARGNSGVILSQWWKGFSVALEGKATFDAPLFSAACKTAVDYAYQAVVNPVEGTILTVTRQAMEVVSEKAHAEPNLHNLFEAKVAAAYESLKHTPDLLPMLKDAGVVDSGGQGWTFIIEGMLRMLRGEDIHIRSVQAVAVQQPGWQESLVPEDEEGYGYDVQFLMKGEGMNVEQIRADIDAIGWSTLVVGDSTLIKVHVHVHDPGVPISYAIAKGAALDDLVVENMQLQYQDYVKGRASREQQRTAPVEGVAVVTTVTGDGFRQMFLNDLGAAYVIAGGQTMNPSTEDFITAIQTLPNTEIILLPNNPNIMLAAQQAAGLAEGKQVRVIPSRSIPQGIAAMFEYTNEKDSLELDGLAENMKTALKNVTTGEITTATRSVNLNGVKVREGEYIGLIDDKLSVAGDGLLSVARALLDKAGADKRELITLYYGDVITEVQAQELAEVLRGEYANAEVQVVNGGQPLYPYVISIE
jgi:DAK2 domain fusion protein YloV